MKNRDIALLLLKRNIEVCALNHYAGLVTMQGLVNLAEAAGEQSLIDRSVELLRPFFEGEIERVGGVYDKMYRCGGGASAQLLKAGFGPDILPVLVAKAEELVNTHPRDDKGVFRAPRGKSTEMIWIDTLFGVCPFLTIVGKLANRPEFIEDAIKQIVETDKVLYNPATGLYHQARGFAGPGLITEDHWGRGNGWAALALTDVLVELPDNEVIRKLYTRLMEACVKYQDDDGMWHQEMTIFRSYVESSGTGLILYAIGKGLEKGFLPESYREIFINGLKGYLTYIGLDGSIFNVCPGCLCPKDGSIRSYMEHHWVLNDCHGFGPAILAFGQAVRLGIMEV